MTPIPDNIDDDLYKELYEPLSNALKAVHGPATVKGVLQQCVAPFIVFETALTNLHQNAYTWITDQNFKRLNKEQRQILRSWRAENPFAAVELAYKLAGHSDVRIVEGLTTIPVSWEVDKDSQPRTVVVNSNLEWQELMCLTYGLRCILVHGDLTKTLNEKGILPYRLRDIIRGRLLELEQSNCPPADKVTYRHFVSDMCFLLDVMESSLSADQHTTHRPGITDRQLHSIVDKDVELGQQDPLIQSAMFSKLWLSKIYRQLTRTACERLSILKQRDGAPTLWMIQTQSTGARST